MISASAPQPVIQPLGAPVQWQTIFWTLVALAINSMAQPGGRICGLPSRYRTYLKCSPIVCCADVLSIVVELIVSCVYEGKPFREAVGMLLHDRFNSEEGSEDGRSSGVTDAPQHGVEAGNEDGGIRSLERMTWLRWLWFILGTLPPTIKLMAMEGTPWEQTWGMMFIISWIINEALVIFTTSRGSFSTISNTGQISWPGFEQQSLSHPERRRIIMITRRILATIALIVHVVILNGIFRTVFRYWTFLVFDVTRSRFEQSPAITLPSLILVSSGVLMILNLVIISLDRFGVSLMQNGFLSLPTLTFIIMLVSYLANISTPHSRFYYTYISSSIPYIFGISTISFLWILAVLDYLARRFLMFGKNFLFTYRDGRDGREKIDQMACLSFLFFLVTVLACGLWYGYIFDPSGTFNPTWTGVFG